MKILFIFLMTPALLFGQTVHIKDEKIVYGGKENIAGVRGSEIFSRMQKLLPAIVSIYKADEPSANSIKAKGELKLKTPYHLVRTVTYSIKLNAMENGYEYLIDSVFFIEKERGVKTIIESSEEVLKKMSGSGKVVSDTEKLLNETDMRFQQVLDALKYSIYKNRFPSCFSQTK